MKSSRRRSERRSRDEWTAAFNGTDACVTPVLSLDEAPDHPHLAARANFVRIDGIQQPAPAPRFSRTPAGVPGTAVPPPIDATEAVRRWGA